MTINLDAWNKLPGEYQEILVSAAREANINMLAKYDALNGAALKRLTDKAVQLKPFSEDILSAAQTAAFELYEENANEDATFKEIYEKWKAFRSDIYGWNKVNEVSFSTFVSK